MTEPERINDPSELREIEDQELEDLSLDLVRMDATDDPAEVAEFFRRAAALTFREENRRGQEGRHAHKLSMSGLGGCTRQASYALARTPITDYFPAPESREAQLGTAMHLYYLPALKKALGDIADVEKPTVLRVGDQTIRGTLDLAIGSIVMDLKTVREYKLSKVRRNGAYDHHKVQVFSYALAEYQAGRPVKWVVFLYLDRSTGEIEVAVERFTNEAAMSVIRRVQDLRRFATTDPDRAPREERGPGLSLACDHCPWLRRCWGPDAAPGDTAALPTLAGDYEGLMHILELAIRGTEKLAQGKNDKDFAKAVLAQVGEGTYGKYKVTRTNPTDVDDVEAMRKRLIELGEPIPKKRRDGSLRIRQVE